MRSPSVVLSITILGFVAGTNGCSKPETPAPVVVEQMTVPVSVAEPLKQPPPKETGTVKVELTINDPSVVLSIDGNEFSVSDLVQPIPLAAGEHTIILKLNGKEVKSRQITVSDGKRQILRMGEPNREAAEWVLRVGGTVRVTAGGKERLVETLGDVPEAAFTIRVINLGKTSFEESEFDDNLQSLSELQEIILDGTTITDASLRCLKSFPKLHTARLHRTAITDAGLAYLEGIDLQVLGLSDTKITDAGLAYLRGMDLRQLNINDTQVTDAGLEHLKGMVNMNLFWADKTAVTDQGLVHLQNLSNLHSICLRNTKVTGSSLAELKSEIHEIWLSGTQLTDADLDQMKNLNIQGRLGLEGTKISDVGLKHLQGMTGIWGLNLNGTKITDVGLSHLKELTKLRYITLGGTNVTEAGVADFKNALPKCDVQK